MKPALVVLAALTVGAGAWALAVLREPPPQVQPEVAPAAPRASASDRALASALQDVLTPPTDPDTLQKPPSVGRKEAEASFDALMESLEAMAESHERLPRARRDELYRNVNDAFSGLSATLDPTSAADMQLLEDANIRMKAMLGELDVRVPKRPPPPP